MSDQMAAPRAVWKVFLKVGSVTCGVAGDWDMYVAAYRLGDAAGCAAIFTDDTEVHSPYGPPARGRAEIEALHGIGVQHAGPNKTLQVIEAGSSENLAWTLATYSEGRPSVTAHP